MEKSSFDIRIQEKDISAKIVAGLERISEAFKVLLWEHAKQLKLSPIQIQILIFIAHHDQAYANVSYLAQEFNLTKPTISDAIKVLLQKGLIKKEVSSTDKRAYRVLLSEAGKKIVEETQKFALPLYKGISDMNGKEQISLFKHISILINKLHESGILSIQRNCQSCRFYASKKKGHYCKLLKMELRDEDLRIDCAEFQESV